MYQKNQPLRILFAEDLPADVEFARREIQKEQIEFTSVVVNTENAFKKMLKEFNPDIVVSDYSMPAFDGMTALKIIRSYPRYIPFIMLTGSINEETAVTCMKAGANDYVLKEQIKRLPFAILEAIEMKKAKMEAEKMEMQLRESEKKFRNLFQNHSAVKLIIDPKTGDILEANAAAEEFYGWSVEELKKMKISQINVLSKEELARELKRASNLKNIFFEFRHRKADGSLLDVEVFSSKVKYEGKEVLHSIVHDVTNKKKTEERLKLLSRAVEQNSVAIEITDSKGNIEYVNPVFTSITGYTFEEVKGKNPRILKSGHQTPEQYKGLWDTILSGRDWEGELMNKKKSGELYWEEVVISPIVNDQGDITHFVAIKEDITGKRKMIEDLVTAKEKAEESDRLKSAFLANISHEIRTPMNGILGFTDLLKEPRLSGKEKEQYRNIIQKSGQRMLSTINDLIEISKIESGTMEVCLSEMNINDQMDYFYHFFKPEAENKGLQFSCHIGQPHEELLLETDAEKLNTILSNLIKNAIKYTSTGRIKFGYSLKGERIVFFVRDSGIGIDKNRQEAIFDRFVQADTSLSKPYEGAGLGLAITKAYVKMLGGKIWLNSIRGKGSEFYFTIPLKKNVQKNSTNPHPDANDPRMDQILQGLTILVAEDDEVARMYLSELLRERCKRLWIANNGKEAVELFKANPSTDLVLMDIKMPIMDGYTASIKIKEINKNTLIVAQTAYALAGDKEKAMAAGCEEYLTKPIKKEILFGVIERHFG